MAVRARREGGALSVLGGDHYSNRCLGCEKTLSLVGTREQGLSERDERGRMPTRKLTEHEAEKAVLDMTVLTDFFLKKAEEMQTTPLAIVWACASVMATLVRNAPTEGGESFRPYLESLLDDAWDFIEEDRVAEGMAIVCEETLEKAEG
jgi:hypothetical protein